MDKTPDKSAPDTPHSGKMERKPSGSAKITAIKVSCLFTACAVVFWLPAWIQFMSGCRLQHGRCVRFFVSYQSCLFRFLVGSNFCKMKTQMYLRTQSLKLSVQVFGWL